MALTTLCQGTSVVTETVFENRFMHVDEFKRMGAKIRMEGRSAIVEGIEQLKGASVNATDLLPEPHWSWRAWSLKAKRKSVIYTIPTVVTIILY